MYTHNSIYESSSLIYDTIHAVCICVNALNTKINTDGVYLAAMH